MENTQDTQNKDQSKQDGKYTCAKCGKEKTKDQGHFQLEGKVFCCENCCKQDGEKLPNVCEFC